MRCASLLTLAILAVPLTGADAQTPRDTLPRLPELEARGVKPVTTTGGASAIRVRVDSLPLPVARALEQVLRRIPQLHVRRNSRGEAEISARGSESRQVAVLQDGIPLTLSWDARTDASVLPAAGVHEVTFIRGLSSMLYGPNVLGGILELTVGPTTHRPASSSADFAFGLDQTGGFGSHGAAVVPLGGPSGHWLLRAGGSFRDSPGVPLARGVVEPIPGEAGLRVNTDSKSVDGFAALRYQGNGGEFLSVSTTAIKMERGIAAELGFNNARFWRYPDVRRAVAVISGGTGHHRSPLGGQGDVEASIGFDVGRTDIDTYSARDYATVSGFEDGKDRTLTLRMLADQSLGSRGQLRTAFTLADTRHHEFLPAGEARYRQQLMSAGAETVLQLLEHGRGINTLRLSLGAAYDVGKTPETGGREPRQTTLTELGGRVALTMVAADGRLQAHAGISRRGRFPALRELYSGALNRFTPNPDLKPENLVAAEAGITARLGNSSEIQVVGFRHQMNDAVVRVTLPDNRFQRVNRNRLKSSGVEVVASTVVGRLSLGADLTVQSVDLTNTQANITNRPENLPDAFGGITTGALLPLGLRLGGDLRYTGHQFCIDPATGDDAELESGVVLGAEVSRAWKARSSGTGWLSRIEARIAVDNIGNTALYDQCRLPEAGRLARFQVRLF